jgi:hypothetical protein
MNPGYLSWLLMVISMILFASGWKDVLMRGMTSRVILLFFVSWLIGLSLVISIPGGRVALWILVLVVLLSIVFWRIEGIVQKLHAISVGVLMGSISFFMQETIQLLPSLVFGNSELTAALVIGILAVTTIKLPSVQIASVSLGLLLGEVFFLYLHRKHVGLEFGSWKLQDRWWLTVFVTRGLSIGMSYVFLVGKYSVGGIAGVIKAGLKKRSGSRD